jgi:hypothetical protein
MRTRTKKRNPWMRTTSLLSRCIPW